MRYLSIALAIVGLALNGTAAARTPENQDVDGNVGLLQVHGKLLQSACRLDLSSSLQTVELGAIASGALSHVGAQGIPVPVEIKLQDCLASNTRSRNERSGNLVRGDKQVSFTWRILAPAVPENPQLVKVIGVSGVGLKVSDENRHALAPGVTSKYRLLDPGQNSLTFYITPQRTSAPLIPGELWSHIYLSLKYD